LSQPRRDSADPTEVKNAKVKVQNFDFLLFTFFPAPCGRAISSHFFQPQQHTQLAPTNQLLFCKKTKIPLITPKTTPKSDYDKNITLDITEFTNTIKTSLLILRKGLS
jgi:hypothetical protein